MEYLERATTEELLGEAKDFIGPKFNGQKPVGCLEGDDEIGKLHGFLLSSQKPGICPLVRSGCLRMRML